MRLLACLTEKLFGGLQAFFRLVLACIDGLAVRQQPVQRVLRRSACLIALGKLPALILEIAQSVLQ